MKCAECGKRPDEIREYINEAAINDMTPEEFVKEEEGTYNPETDRFYCTHCYMKLGMPTKKP